MKNIKIVNTKIFNKRVSAQITIETAIIMPIVIMVIAGFICMSLYIHDVITIKSSFYKVGVESVDKEFREFQDKVNNKAVKVPLFILKPKVYCEEENRRYIIRADVKSESNFNLINNMINTMADTYTIEIEKNMSREILYAVGAIKKEILK